MHPSTRQRTRTSTLLASRVPTEFTRISNLNIISLNIQETAAPEKETELSPGAEVTSEQRTTLSLAKERELGLKLLALSSFFNLRNHSFSDLERESLADRDFSEEVLIAEHYLRRSLQLIGNMSSSEQVTPSVSAPPPMKIGRLEEMLPGLNPSLKSAFNELSEVLEDLANLCAALLKAPQVKFQAWASLGNLLNRELSGAGASLKRLAQVPAPAPAVDELFLMAQRVSPEPLGADLAAVFSALVLMLERLEAIKPLLESDVSLKQTLPIFTLLHDEGRDLVEWIEKRAMRTKELPEELFDALDRTGYALRMELYKVFSHELVGLADAQRAPTIYSKIENAHGLLRDCFQQSMVALAQLFDESLDGAQLFTGFSAKLDQSLVLRQDLWDLLQIVSRAARDGGRRPVGPLLERLTDFQNGSLRHLMYKDWETYERFVVEIASTRGSDDLTTVFHRLGTYLETLFGQINMRAVLAEQPFDYPGLEN
ncbi:MAG: hypothetical protein H0T45_13170 [Pyrinomonadaceae bacterium]|nr:hypothetical protein [Pyrinomonadaceae bacterium]